MTVITLSSNLPQIMAWLFREGGEGNGSVGLEQEKIDLKLHLL